MIVLCFFFSPSTKKKKKKKKKEKKKSTSRKIYSVKVPDVKSCKQPDETFGLRPHTKTLADLLPTEWL